MERARTTGFSIEEAMREAFREVVRDELRTIIREELAAALFALPKAPALEPARLYLDPQAAAEIAGVSGKTVRRWIQDGLLKATKFDRLIRIARADLDQLMATGGSARSGGLTVDEAVARIGERRRQRTSK